MKLTSQQRYDISMARLDASLSAMAFAANKMAEAAQEFSFVFSMSCDTDEAARSKEMTEAAIARQRPVVSRASGLNC